jgi:serine/threonine protein phosphatase PrpC
MKFSVFQVSRRGGREKNEDRMGYCYTRESCLMALADGMGGHPEGEVASQLTLQTMAALFQRDAKPQLPDPMQFLTQAVMSAHHQILRYASDKGLLDSPRTTIVACVVQNGCAYWVHCGDSRLYFVRGEALVTRTRDHSYLERQSNGSGQVVPLPTQKMVSRNVLFTCLGSPSRPVVDAMGPVPLSQGDRLLLCSDGLWGTLDDDTIVAALAHAPVHDAVPELVEQALRVAGGSSDNVTVIALDWETPDDFDSTRSGISTESIRDEVFSSTIQAGVLGTAVDDLDDEAIERSIAEINEAIRRTAAKIRS